MAQEAISLSQDSILSEVSVTSAPRKRLRKCSEIKDLIRLTELQSVARANQQLQQWVTECEFTAEESLDLTNPIEIEI